MNHNKWFTLCMIALLTDYDISYAMNYNDYTESYEQPFNLPQGELYDQLWNAGKIVASSPQSGPSNFFALHDLIQSQDTLTAPIDILITKVAQLLEVYPRYLSITNRQEQTVFDLLGLQLARTDLSDQAKSNFIGLKEFLESHKKN